MDAAEPRSGLAFAKTRLRPGVQLPHRDQFFVYPGARRHHVSAPVLEQCAAVDHAIDNNHEPVTEHGQLVPEHFEPIAEHGQSIAEHFEPIAEHGEPIAEHGEPIAEHGEPIAEHTELVPKHREPGAQRKQPHRGPPPPL
ncbi:MAG: hypothetical protein JRJ84_19760 [Deltaproteobacteria bacterium]|nr:hypothetical protein [Deltaproteobacteria bacterium]